MIGAPITAPAPSAPVSTPYQPGPTWNTLFANTGVSWNTGVPRNATVVTTMMQSAISTCARVYRTPSANCCMTRPTTGARVSGGTWMSASAPSTHRYDTALSRNAHDGPSVPI